MVHKMLEGKDKEALPLHYQMLKMNGLIFADGNPAGIKALMAHIGLCKNILRLPLVPASDEVCQRIEIEYDNYIK